MRNKSIRPKVKVWNLPKLNEARMEELYEIFSEVFVVNGRPHIYENEPIFSFPTDMMEKDLGMEIYIEISGPTNDLYLSSLSARYRLRTALCVRMKLEFPNAFYIDCSMELMDGSKEWTVIAQK